jgi:inhibitor of cysteine peptidase
MDVRNRCSRVGMLAVVVAASAVLAAACGSSSGGSASPAPLATSVYVNDSSGDGKATSVGVAVQTGGQVWIRLAENPTTGYEWSFRLPPGVTEVSSSFTGPSPSPSPAMGAGGTRTYVVRVGQPGVYTVRAAYARPWGSRMPEKTFTVQIFAPPASQPNVTDYFTEKNSPGLFDTDVGRTFAVVLKENPSTGYSWTMKLGPGLKLLNDQFVAPSPSPVPLVGAGGQRIWVVTIEKAGKTTATGIYARPSDAATENAASFSLTIEASPIGQ